MQKKKRMRPSPPPDLSRITEQFLSQNYNYMWLKTMLNRGANVTDSGSTLITGSSHAVYGIEECAWKNAVNCSLDSQDLYYSFKGARRIIESAKADSFRRCFIFVGYFTPYSDISLSEFQWERLMAPVFVPIYNDAHNWKNPHKNDPWVGFSGLTEWMKASCERAASAEILKYGTYYSPLRKRTSFYDLNGRVWSDVAEDEKQAMGKDRAQRHGRKYEASLTENKEILKEYVHFLNMNEVQPIVVVPPYTSAYNQYISPEAKEAILELVGYVPEEIQYIDFNQNTTFDDLYFMDTDHLNERGAHIMSEILVKIFSW